jgi:hypothetical protein
MNMMWQQIEKLFREKSGDQSLSNARLKGEK